MVRLTEKLDKYKKETSFLKNIKYNETKIGVSIGPKGGPDEQGKKYQVNEFQYQADCKKKKLYENLL